MTNRELKDLIYLIYENLKHNNGCGLGLAASLQLRASYDALKAEDKFPVYKREVLGTFVETEFQEIHPEETN
jgi:hypothetical protein